MQNTNDNQGKGAKPNTLGNDEILEFAEEVLGASEKDEIINLQDAQAVVEDGGEDIIDLTEVADEPQKQDADEVLDLTDIADNSQSGNDGIFELNDMSASGKEVGTDDAIMELEDVIDAFDNQEDDLVDLEEIAVEPDAADEEILDDVDGDDIDLGSAIADQDEDQSFLDEEEFDQEDLDALDELVPEEDDIADLQNAQMNIESDQPDEAFNDPMAPQTETDESSTGQDAFTNSIEDDMPLQDLDLEDIANEFVSAINDSDEDFEPPSGVSAEDPDADMISEDDLASAMDLPDIMDSAPQTDSQPAVEAPESEESDPVSDDDDVVDLDGFEADDDVAVDLDGFEADNDDAVDLSGFEANDDNAVDLGEFEADNDDVVDLGEFDPDDDNAVDLDGFEAESLASQMISEPSDLHTDMSIPAMESETDQGIESESPPEFEEPAMMAEDASADIEFNEQFETQTDQESSGADDAPEVFSDFDKEPDMPLEATIDKLFPQSESEPALDMQSSASETDLAQEPELPTDPVESMDQESLEADLKEEAAADQTPQMMEPPSDRGLELDLENDLESGKSIQVVHKTSVEKEYPPVEEPEDLSIEGIDAAEDISPMEQAGGAMEIELSGTEQLEEGQSMDETGFQVTYAGEDEASDIHRTGDPISIKVKEHGSEDHASADDLLKVFDNHPQSGSLEGIESAIENVVQNMLSEKIEVLLSSAIEKAVTREIERLKTILLSDLKSNDEP